MRRCQLLRWIDPQLPADRLQPIAGAFHALYGLDVALFRYRRRSFILDDIRTISRAVHIKTLPTFRFRYPLHPRRRRRFPLFYPLHRYNPLVDWQNYRFHIRYNPFV